MNRVELSFVAMAATGFLVLVAGVIMNARHDRPDTAKKISGRIRSRLSDIEQLFVCTACGKRSADVRFPSG